MKDRDLRSAFCEFIEHQNALTQKLHESLLGVLEHVGSDKPIYDAIEGHIKFLGGLQKAGERFLKTIADTRPAPATVTPAPVIAPPELPASEQKLVTLYNAEPAKWTQTYRPADFGAENVNEIWEKGGEPRFARKEGGIYNLVDTSGVSYVVPEPGLRLQQGYFRSEGLGYLFNVSGDSADTEPLICLVRPAIVEEAAGRWTILRKGELKGRS